MKKQSLTKNILGTHWLHGGILSHPDGSISKGYEVEPLSSGVLEEGFEGPNTDTFFAKLSDLITKLPNLFDGHILLCRRQLKDTEVSGFQTKLFFFETVQKPESYSHLNALLRELKLIPTPISFMSWLEILSGFFGTEVHDNKIPDLTWDKNCISIGEKVARVLSLTELPQISWKGCLQPIFESQAEFVFSIRLSIPDRAKLKRQLETKRRVSSWLAGFCESLALNAVMKN